MKISTLQPGLLVALSVRTKGNVRYDKVVLESDRVEGTTRTEKWETTRTIEDAEEHALATKARSKARSIISSVCTNSSFGLLCAESKADILTAAIADARAVVETFNGKAKLTRLSVYVMAGRIAADDVEAVKAINSEVRALIDDMEAGVKNMDAAKIREAASQAKDIGKMLRPDMQERLEMAISAVRSQARAIVKAGETAAVEIDQSVLNRLSAVRAGFLDLDDTGQSVELPLVGRAVDLMPQEPRAQWPVMPTSETAAILNERLEEDGLPPIITAEDVERTRNLELE